MVYYLYTRMGGFMANIFQISFYNNLYCNMSWDYVEKIFYGCAKYDNVFRELAKGIKDNTVFRICDMKGQSSFTMIKRDGVFYRREKDEILQVDLEIMFKSMEDLKKVLGGSILFRDVCVEGRVVINGNMTQANYVTQCMERVMFYKIPSPLVKNLYGEVPERNIAARVHANVLKG